MKKLLLVLFLFPVMALADGLVSEPGIVLLLQKLIDFIPGGLPTIVTTVLGMLCDLVLRMWPTVKPKSLFLVVAKVCGLIAAFFMKISQLLDKVVQNLKDPE